MKKCSKIIIAAVVVCTVGALGVAGYVFVRTANAPRLPVRISWFENATAPAFKEIVKQFTVETGIPVIVELTRVADWQAVAYGELQTGYPGFDLLVGDSQWLGYTVSSGYYEELTDFVRDHDLEGVFIEAAVRGYGEYPDGSGRYYAIPFNGNTMMYAYRKDWFEDAVEKENFHNRYGYELSVPKTFTELYDIAEFFYRPEEQRYGIIFPSGLEYDSVTIGLGTFLFGFGGSWGDRSTCVADGRMNGDGAVAALEYMRNLYQFTPLHTDQLRYAEIPGRFFKGDVAIMADVVTHIARAVCDIDTSVSCSIGYFSGLFGPRSRYEQLSGQGISLVTGARNRKGALAFLDWWVREDTQNAFAAAGGFSTHRRTLASRAFIDGTPYNAIYATSMQYVKDFWNSPHYADMLSISQKFLHPYVVGESALTAQETLDTIVREWNPILEHECQ